MPNTEILEYKCPCCGGVVEFDSSTQLMKCPYCDTTFDPAALMEKDEALNQPPADEMQWESVSEEWPEDETSEMNVYTCKSCGGEIIADANTGATHCPFCGNPVVLTSRFTGALKPDYVLPFQLSKEDAKQKLKAFMKQKKLLPKLFSEENHLDEIKGIYVPFWLYNADADADLNYHATRTRMWRSGDTEYTETSHFRLVRQGTLGFANVPVDGSSVMDDTLMESIEPFDVSQAKPFQTAYLSGYYADKYDIDAKQSEERANQRIRATTEDAFRSTVSGYATVAPERSTIRLTNTSTHYALYPVWLLNTTYKGQKYQFAMNGQTGKFVGDMPIDKKAYWKWRLIYTLPIAGVIWLLLYLFLR